MKPSIPQGTRDFSPSEVRRRQYIFTTLRTIFELYGFQPLETPAMENLETLLGKYGDEGDRLIFKILNNGLADPKNSEKAKAAFENVIGGKSDKNLTERALRYDLTIPFARYVAVNHQTLALPFKRYQMQPVWRGDRPAHGRYREFWQCDCDVVGSTSLLNEAELLCIYQRAFHELKLPQVSVKINSRKLLAALAEWAGAPEQMMDVTIALDKLDKIAWDGVRKELEARGIPAPGIEKIESWTKISGDNDAILTQLADLLKGNETGEKGIEELRKTLAYHASSKEDSWDSQVVIDLSLARGLNYYTGIIMEVTTSAAKMGSIGGGGRYDDLTGLFGVKGISGVGISFGIDRIYDVLEELSLFPEAISGGAKVAIINFGGEDELYALGALKALRGAGIAAELYPDSAKFDKQMKWADKRGIPFVLIAGEKERREGLVAIKEMKTGEQRLLTLVEARKMFVAHEQA